MSDTELLDSPLLGDRYQDFVDFLKEVDTPGPLLSPLLSPRRFCRALHIDLQTLAEQAHVHRNTIARAPGSRGIQDFLREALQAIKAATDLNGNLNQALFWYRNAPLAAFACKSAERLVSEGRADDLVRYVASLEAGVAG